MKYKLVAVLTIPPEAPHQLELVGNYGPHGEGLVEQTPLVNAWVCHHMHSDSLFVDEQEIEMAVATEPQLVNLPHSTTLRLFYLPVESERPL